MLDGTQRRRFEQIDDDRRGEHLHHTAADMGGGVLPIHNDLQRMVQPRTQVHGASYET